MPTLSSADFEEIRNLDTCTVSNAIERLKVRLRNEDHDGSRCKTRRRTRGRSADFYADPLGFVLFAHRCGEPGELSAFSGPDTWHREFLGRLGARYSPAAPMGEVP